MLALINLFEICQGLRVIGLVVHDQDFVGGVSGVLG